MSDRTKYPFINRQLYSQITKENKSGQSNYQKKLNNFGSYFITLLCPWSCETGVTEYEPSYRGLKNWQEQTNILNNDERIAAINSGFHPQRVTYMER